MKKLVVFLLPLMLIISCEKENTAQGFKTLPILDLRVNNNLLPSLWLTDYPEEIVPLSGTNPVRYDTLGRTKVFFNKDLIFDYQWEFGYQSPIHRKSKVLFSATEKTEVVFISRTDVFFTMMAIISNGSLIKKIDFSTVNIKKVEIDEINKQLRVTSNKGWTRTGELPDDITVINY
ncbi:MAG: hypothetical protein NTY31_00280 [Candidatus Falkowbacteria bacterium]|nr:hypothetical protein [Candidatus Falkowbacteria bacterium]